MEEKLYKMWLFREELPSKNNEGIANTTYALRNARLSGAISLITSLGYVVEFNPLAENKNPFTVKEVQ